MGGNQGQLSAKELMDRADDIAFRAFALREKRFNALEFLTTPSLDRSKPTDPTPPPDLRELEARVRDYLMEAAFTK